MKITRRQLMRIIREEAESFGGGHVQEDPIAGKEDEELNQNNDPGLVSDIETIPEARATKLTRGQLRRIIKEQAAGGLPSVDDLAKKLGAAGPEAAIDFIQRLLTKANFSAPEPEVEEAPVVEPELPPVPPEEV